MYEDAPPLKVWAVSFFSIVSLLILYFTFTYTRIGPYAKAVEKSNKNLEAALIELTKDTSALSVVIVGSSLIEDALLDPHVLESELSSVTNRKVKVLRVAIYFMTMEVANRIQFYEYIRKYPPDYLFVENFCMNLVSRDGGTSIPIPMDASLLLIRNNIKGFLGLKANEYYYNKWYTFDTRPIPESDFYTDEFDSTTFKALQKESMIVKEVSQNKIANETYDLLAKANSKIIFLDMPQTNELPFNLMDKPALTDFIRVMGEYNKLYNVEYWPYPDNMPDTYFSDGYHLNYKGGKKYQEWFVSAFASTR